MRTTQPLVTLVVFSLAFVFDVSQAETTFTYQGRLGSAGQPAEGKYDFVFRLFDMETNGAQIGSDLHVNSVLVSSGVFTITAVDLASMSVGSVPLDFGDAPFNSSPRWLEIDVRESGGGMYTTLTPRQRVRASPFASAGQPAEGNHDFVFRLFETLFVAPGAVDTAALQDNAVTQSKLADNSVGTSQIQNNSVSTSDIRDGAVSSIDIQDATISSTDLAPGIYRTKSDLYVVTGPDLSLTLAPQTQTVACVDANDLPLSWSCRNSGPSGFLATSSQTANWSNAMMPAQVTCSGVNVHPSNPAGNPQTFSASIMCVSVP